MSIGYKYNSRRVLFIFSDEGYIRTDTGDICLYCFYDNYSSFSDFLVVYPCIVYSGLNSCNAIYQHNNMCKYDLALEKYWVTQSGYFRLATTVALDMGITYGKLLFCHSISQDSEDKTISTREYHNRTVYD